MSLDRATVHTVTPLTVVLDSSTTALPAINAGGPTMTIGDRVLVESVGSAGGQLAVIGQISSMRRASGKLDVLSSGTSNQYTPAPIAFPVGRFTAPPIVHVTPVIAGAGSITEWGADSITAVGCNIGVARTATSVVTTLMWTATEDNA